MIKTRNQLQAVADLLLDYGVPDGGPVTIERIAFALGKDCVIAIPVSGRTLVAEFSAKAIKRILHNPYDSLCYLVGLHGENDDYEEAVGVVVQINPPEEADGTGRAVYYAAVIEHEMSGGVGLYQTIKHPKRKAKKVPALGYQGGSLKISAKAPKKGPIIETHGEVWDENGSATSPVTRRYRG